MKKSIRISVATLVTSVLVLLGSAVSASAVTWNTTYDNPAICARALAELKAWGYKITYACVKAGNGPTGNIYVLVANK